MRSYPSPGDAIPRLIRLIQDEIRRLKQRLAFHSSRIDALEAGGGGSGGGGVSTVVAGDGIDVSSSNPARPVVSVEPSVMQDGDPAGGVLAGWYPNPSFSQDMATQAELEAAIAAIPPPAGGGEDVYVEDPGAPGTYIGSTLYVGETDPAIGGEDPYIWLDPSALGGNGSSGGTNFAVETFQGNQSANQDMNWTTIANYGPQFSITIPAWATKADIVVGVIGVYGITATGGYVLQVSLDGLVGRNVSATGIDPAGASPRFALTWCQSFTGFSTGPGKTLGVRGWRSSGTGSLRNDTGSDFTFQVIWTVAPAMSRPAPLPPESGLPEPEPRQQGDET